MEKTGSCSSGKAMLSKSLIQFSGLIPELKKPPGEGNGNPLQYSCPENLIDIRTWWATVHAVTRSWT